MKNVIILLSVFLFLFVAGVGNAGKDNKGMADYNLYYDNNGKIVDAGLTNKGKREKCKLKTGKEVTPELLLEIKNEYTNFEALGAGVIKFSGNSYCIIYMGGWPVCICCP